MKLTLKRGSGRHFDGQNWKLAGDKQWVVQPLFVPHALEKEKHVGNRMIDGVEHAVYLCLNDEFFAQPVSICELPKPADMTEVMYSLEVPVVEEKPRSAQKGTQGFKVLTFVGKNWKLAGDKAWKTSTAFSKPGDKGSRYTEKELVGERKIGSQYYEVYSSSSGFVAFKHEHTQAKVVLKKLEKERKTDEKVLAPVLEDYNVK
jgi:hypothetical protein